LDKQKNNLSLAFGVPGILLQMGGVCLPGALVGSNVSPNAASLIFLGCLLVGTALLIVGLAFYAMAKGHSPLWCLMGLLGIIGLSNAPVGVVNNSLPQLNHRINGLPVNCVVRGLLEQPSYEAAVAFVQKANHASGQNYIIGGPDGSAMFECSANEVARVPEAEGIRRQIHTNHPLVNTDINEVPELAVSTSSSNTEVRLNVLQQRILETTSDITLGIIKDTLSSHDDPENPVCRHHNPENPGASFTAASVIYEMSAPPVMHIAPGPPCETEFESYTF